MVDNNKVSIIIPIYNAETYLFECLESVLIQEYENIDVIMVDDGSTDDSLFICKDFCIKDNRFSVYTKNNTGVSDTRNFGLSKATGKYVYFMDADDVIKNNTISSLVKLYNNDIQLAMCSYDKIVDNSIKSEYVFNDDIIFMDNLKAIENICLNHKIQGYLWNKLFLRELLLDIKFDEQIKICEDQLFCIQYLTYINNVAYIDSPLYNYRINPNSATNITFNSNTITKIDAYDKMLDIIKIYSKDNLFKEYFLNKSHEIIVLCSVFYVKLVLNKIKNRKQYIKIFREYYNKYKYSFNKNNLTLKQKICFIIFKFRLFIK